MAGEAEKEKLSVKEAEMKAKANVPPTITDADVKKEIEKKIAVARAGARKLANQCGHGNDFKADLKDTADGFTLTVTSNLLKRAGAKGQSIEDALTAKK